MTTELIREIEKIAEHYGYESQSRQLVEEMAELTVALNKKWRLEQTGNANNPLLSAPCMANLVEEIADVEIMLMQVKYLLGCNRVVESAKAEKISRQTERMAKGE